MYKYLLNVCGYKRQEIYVKGTIFWLTFKVDVLANISERTVHGPTGNLNLIELRAPTPYCNNIISFLLILHYHCRCVQYIILYNIVGLSIFWLYIISIIIHINLIWHPPQSIHVDSSQLATLNMQMRFYRDHFLSQTTATNDYGLDYLYGFTMYMKWQETFATN